MNIKKISVLTQLGIQMDTMPSKQTKETSSTSLLNILTTNNEKNKTVTLNENNPKLIAFTDGACSHNGSKFAKAGYAVVWPYHPELNTSKRLIGCDQTNNRAEFSALIEAQLIADTIEPLRQQPLYVYTDSQLLINSITKWLPDWKKNNWKKADKKPVLNQDLLKKIDENPRPLIFTHVRAHTGKRDWESTHNEEADRLAREAIMK